MMSEKMATLGPLMIKSFWVKDFDVITSAHDVSNKILLSECYILDVVLWPKFGNSSTSMREVIITSIL